MLELIKEIKILCDNIKLLIKNDTIVIIEK